MDKTLGHSPLFYMYYIGLDLKAPPAAYMRKLATTELVACPKTTPTLYAAMKAKKDGYGALHACTCESTTH